MEWTLLPLSHQKTRLAIVIASRHELPSTSEIDLSTPEKCNQLIERIKSLQAAGRLEPGQARVMIQTVNNALELHKRAG